MAANKRQLDQIAAIKARVAGLAAPASDQPPDPPATQPPDPPAAPLNQSASPPANRPADRQEEARSHFFGHVERLIEGRTIERLPVGQVAPDLRPGMRQLRMLPLPEELLSTDVPPTYTELIDELRTLGQSLKERQLQPIIVYPGSSERYPTARYLILIGQRRWTAAHLVGLTMIDAVIVDPPTPLERVRLQYSENDDREDFSDMERAWALQQLRQALGGEAVPISAVAAHLNIKRSRAYQLLRLLAFTPQQQRTIVLLRLQERQVLSLTDALHQQQIALDQVDTVLERLGTIARERAAASAALAATETTRTTDSPRRSGIDAQTVARVVARVVASARPNQAAPEQPRQSSTPRWYGTLRASLARTAGGLRRAHERVEMLGPDEAAALQAELADLQHQLASLAGRLATRAAAEGEP